MLHFTFIWPVNFNQFGLQTYQNLESTVGIFCFMSQVRHVTSQKVINVSGWHRVLSSFIQGFSALFTALLPGHRVRHQTVFGFSLMRKLTPTTQSNWRFYPCLKIIISKTTSLHTMMAAESGVLQHWHTFHTGVTNSVTHNEDDKKFPSRFQYIKPLKMCGMFLETFWLKFPWEHHTQIWGMWWQWSSWFVVHTIYTEFFVVCTLVFSQWKYA
jgi:hypothetical protein